MGQWVASGDGTCSPVINPSDGSVVTEVDVATDEQVQAAIAAARRAFDETDWPRSSTGERAALLDRVADLLERDLEELARRGDPEHRQGDAREPLRYRGRDPCLPLLRRPRRQGGGAPRRDGRPRRRSSRIVYEPVGVCGLIGPWNYPLLQLSWKIAPALAAGNTAGHEARAV